MPIERKQIEKSLPKKGFVPEERKKHRYFHHVVGGRRTGYSTYVSRSSGFNTIDDSLLKYMKVQLALESSAQVRNLIECPWTGDDYNQYLRSKGLLQ